MEEMIIVEVDDRAAHYGYGAYTNSAVQGNHADYVADDLVRHIDAMYRTVADRDSRGVAGFSLGGRGTLTLAMQRPDVFGAAYAINVSPLCFSRPECSEQLFEDTARFSKAGEDYWGVTLAEIAVEHSLLDTPDQVPNDFDFSMAAAFSPNADNPPFFVDFPYELNEDLKVVPEIRDKWYQHDLLYMLTDHADDLASLRGLVIDHGDQDLPLVPEHQLFHQALIDAGIPHEFRTYSGGHLDRWSERFQLAAQFFSDTLISPEPVRACDFNIDAACDVDDVDQLMGRIPIGSRAELYDLNESGTVELGDLELLIQKEIGTWFGDADLNGEVDFGDFLALSANFGQDGGWAQGDFDASGDVQFADFLLLSSNFGNMREATLTQSVPEPNAAVLIVLSCCMCPFRRRLTRASFTSEE
jgi:S-formylglutathione hydrolase FrmB